MPKLRFLGDSNVIIALDPATRDRIDAATPIAVEFHELLSRGGHQFLRHPASQHDFARDQNQQRAQVRAELLRKYTPLEDPVPTPAASMLAVLGAAALGTNDWVDDQLLGAVAGHSVDYLVTDDVGIHRKARQLADADAEFARVPDRVITIGDAIQLLRGLFDHPVPPPPVVRLVPGHALREEDPIFSTFRADYADFDQWMRGTVKPSGRPAWVIDAREDDRYAAICIFKPEEGAPLGLPTKVLKLCSFKVADDQRGQGYAELLLKAAFDHAVANAFDCAYVDILPWHQGLATLMEAFGFEVGDVTDRGESRYVKRFARAADATDLDALRYHIRYGPPALRLDERPYIVPIWPSYHRQLFPEAEMQQQVFPHDQPYGNALRKAYLCHSRITPPDEGATLLFYRTRPYQDVISVGVVEAALRSEDPEEISLFVGNRTVFPYDALVRMCERGEVLAIRFRQDRILGLPLTLSQLASNDLMTRPPQSIMRAHSGGMPWLRNRLNA